MTALSDVDAPVLLLSLSDLWRYTGEAHDFPRTSVIHIMARKTSPIALFCLLASPALFLAALALPAAASPVHARAHLHATGSRSAGKSKSKSAKAHKAGLSAKDRRKSGGPAERAEIAPSRRGRSARAVMLRPQSKAALRAHGRIRAAMQSRRGRRPAPLPPTLMPVHFVMPPPLRGTHESLVHQNMMAEADGLERILDDADLDDRIAHGSLVPVPTSAILRINSDLPENRRYCRPWTAKFLNDLAQAHASKFGGDSLEVTSAVRTVEYQRRLRHVNGNAAAADGDIASPHLTGGTIDIGKSGMSAREIGWLRGWLIPLEQQGKIDVAEEFKQSCFHISVYKSYSEPVSSPRKPVIASPLDSASIIGFHGR